MQPPVRTVLIAIDGSEHSFRALEFYAEHCRCEADRLVFPFVVEPPSLTRGAAGSLLVENEFYSGLLRDAVEQGKQMGQRVRDRCRALGLRCPTKFIERLSSQAGPAIVEVAKEEGASLVLVGSRGLGTLRRTILGSVSDYVLHHAHLPVILVPEPLPARHH